MAEYAAKPSKWTEEWYRQALINPKLYDRAWVISGVFTPQPCIPCDKTRRSGNAQAIRPSEALAVMSNPDFQRLFPNARLTRMNTDGTAADGIVLWMLEWGEDVSKWWEQTKSKDFEKQLEAHRELGKAFGYRPAMIGAHIRNLKAQRRERG